VFEKRALKLVYYVILKLVSMLIKDLSLTGKKEQRTDRANRSYKVLKDHRRPLRRDTEPKRQKRKKKDVKVVNSCALIAEKSQH
jgi:hypothetical protein